MNFTRKQYDFKVPDAIEKKIDDLEYAVKNNTLDIDIYECEIRQLAHEYSGTEITDEQGDEIIHYYCSREYLV